VTQAGIKEFNASSPGRHAVIQGGK
jgi:hypothetical protein